MSTKIFILAAAMAAATLTFGAADSALACQRSPCPDTYSRRLNVCNYYRKPMVHVTTEAPYVITSDHVGCYPVSTIMEGRSGTFIPDCACREYEQDYPLPSTGARLDDPA